MKLKMMRKLIELFIILFFLFGCAKVTSYLPLPVPETPPPVKETFPNYNMPEDQFGQIDFKKLASEFKDEYSGQYVIINGFYGNSYENPILKFSGGQFVARSMRGMVIYEKKMKYLDPNAKRVEVFWPNENKEDGRTLVDLNVFDKIKVYAYVFPKGQEPSTRKGTLFYPYDEATIWMLRVVPVK